MDYIVTGDTDVGTSKSINQDSFNVQIVNLNGEKFVFAILCDGMGGHEKGELASATVVEEFKKWLEIEFINIYSDGLNEDKLISSWTNTLNQVNTRILNYGANNDIVLGTTLTLLLLSKDNYFILNIGDTRAYKLSKNIKQITKDQTLVYSEVERGILTEEEAKKDPRRSVLLQSIGASTKINADYFVGKNKKDTVYILCTDGFRHEISNEEIYNSLNPNVLQNEELMRKNCRYLIDLNKQRNEKDNISIILVRTF